MDLPKQVDEAVDLAEQLFNQMHPTEETSTEEPVVEEDIPIEEAEEVVPHDDDLVELRKFKSRYQSLKGKYDAEVPRLSQELKDLKQSVFERLDQAVKKPEVAKEEEVNESEFLDSFKEKYGDEFADSLVELFTRESKKSQKPIHDKVTSIEDTQQKTAQSNFVNYIDEHLNTDREKPLDWQGLWSGKDPKFLEFLEKPDPSGLYTYRQLAELYNENWDADKLVSIFKIYDSENKPVVKEVKPKTNPVSPQRQALVAPNRTNTHVTPDTESKQIWTSSMMEEFTRLDRQGKYSAEDSKAMWEDLLSALGENRIRN